MINAENIENIENIENTGGAKAPVRALRHSAQALLAHSATLLAGAPGISHEGQITILLQAVILAEKAVEEMEAAVKIVTARAEAAAAPVA
jgi:hypothetical protein